MVVVIVVLVELLCIDSEFPSNTCCIAKKNASTAARLRVARFELLWSNSNVDDPVMGGLMNVVGMVDCNGSSDPSYCGCKPPPMAGSIIAGTMVQSNAGASNT